MASRSGVGVATARKRFHVARSRERQVRRAAEEHVALLGCVKQLGDVQRHVVTMRVLEELTPQDTAGAVGLSAGHVGVLLHRAKRALIECLEMETRGGV